MAEPETPWKKHLPPFHPHVLLAGLFLLALALRVHALDLVHFNIDESLAATVATQIATLRRFPLLGIETSFGFHNPPLFLYLLAPFFAISSNPLFAQFFVAAAGAAAVPIVWRTGQLLGGAPVAWTAAALLAFSPNAVEHSRRLWGHDLVVFFGALALWGAVAALRRGSARALAGSFLAAAAAQCLHLSGALLWLPGLAVLLSRSSRKNWAAFAVGVGGLLLLYAPWIIHEIQHGFEETRHVLAVVFGGSPLESLEHPVPPFVAWTLVLGDFWHIDLLGHWRPWMVSAPATVAELALTLLAFAGLAAGIGGLAGRIRAGEREDRTAAFALAIPLLASPIAFGVLLRAAVPPYHLPALVPAVLALAWTLGPLARGRGRPVVIGLAVLYAIVSVALTFEVRRAIAGGQSPTVPLREKMAVIEEIASSSENESFYLMQNGRAPGTGVDVGWLYLVHWAEAYERVASSPENAGPIIVIHEHQARLRPAIANFLRRTETVSSPHVSIHRVPEERKEEWLGLLRKYPAPSHPEGPR